MTKRLIDVDDELVERAREAFGTKTLKDTVNTALAEALRTARPRRRLTPQDVERFVKATEDLRNPEVMAKAWE